MKIDSRTRAPLRPAALAAALSIALAAALALPGCGGGGSDAGGSGTPESGSGGRNNGSTTASSVLAQHCAVPRGSSLRDANGQPYHDVQGTLTDEKNWVRAWIDETYLWYADVRGLSASAQDAGRYANAVAYFDALKSPAVTTSGRAKDRFHFTYDTQRWIAQSTSGVTIGYGFEVALLAAAPPRQAVIAYTDPNTPAAAANIARGAEVLRVDGVDLVNDNTQSGIDTLNAGLFPQAAGTHVLRIRDAGASGWRDVTLTAGQQTSTPVQNVRTLPAPNQRVGYLLFNDHIATAESQLLAAIVQLRNANVTDLVLDIRYNGGGYLDIASELAYMIAGPGPTAGKTFEKLEFNDRNPFGLTDTQRTTPFHAASQGFSATSGQALPWLGLSRVYVLAGADTCSASEAIVNGLRGVGVAVNLIGATTCGKPYGFYPQDNCGTTFFAIQFKGVNQLGFGDYADGFAPTCAVDDDFAHALGDPAEARLATALVHRATGNCTASGEAGMARAQSARAAGEAAQPLLLRSPLRENRFYRDSR